MANPAPTINQINAFNATQGTTIDFNIIGGTELVRSNRIYIYDLSDNSLICTHLYVSTESIHELPANTDSSIVYESGKSSADFVNGAQYYAQIQTYTDTAGTQGGSGLSVAKMFWCLVDPTLTITTIPSTISTTSYNVSATYTDTSASVVSNIIQQYQFNLYSAVGSLLQSSGVVVGSGTQQGTSDSYDISYNFTGLNVGSSYYVTVEVTTTQGMNVNAQSGTFTVSIDTPTLGEATVVNNACDGYISVTSNLSGEYGGSASGEIASFVTDSVNNISSLKVNLDPVQDLHGYDAPWVGGAGKNKLHIDATTTTQNGVTFTVNTDRTVTVNGTATANATFVLATVQDYVSAGTSITVNGCPSGGSSSTYRMFCSSVGYDYGNGVTGNVPTSTAYIGITIFNGYTANNMIFKPMIRLSSVTDATFAPYENICPISGHDEVGVGVVGKNLLAKPFSFRPVPSTLADCFFIKKGTYTFSFDSIGTATSWRFGVSLFDSDGNALNDNAHKPNAVMNYVSSVAMWWWGDDINIKSFTISIVEDCYTRIWFGSGNTDNTMTATNAMLNIGNTAFPYEPYNGHTYTTTLPSTTYGGTLDVVSGELTVTHLFFEENTADMNNNENYPGWLGHPELYNVVAQGSQAALDDLMGNIGEYASFNNIGSGLLYLPTNRYGGLTQSEWKAMAVDVQFVLPLLTPQTYQLTPQQIQTLVGQNNVWSEQGDVELSYHIPITNLLVKRQDVDDVSGSWLTLYSQPITQASDMDFTFIDFTNQYGKTYKYALVPLLTQTQSGVEVEVEGGYTVSDEVQSIFDGVFIVDATGSQKCKANVGYGNVDMNQVVGSITPIGAKYPIVITNSQNQYHNGSISGTIVPDDYYFNGNLSRIDMVNKRDELEQFLTNKRAKIIKDWNGNIWLVMIMDNVSCTFNNSYGMGIVNFNTNWVEVGDPTNQQDLQATGLINVGGV